MSAAAPSTELAKVEAPGALARQEDFGISVDQLVSRVEKVRKVSKSVMQKDVHYGEIPGTKKSALLKPGAEMLCMTFQLAPTFHLDERRDGEHMEVVVTCTLTHAPTGVVLGNAIGSCSTMESKYAWRKATRTCPECGKATIIKGKKEYGGGWLCWKKPDRGSDGCGAKFKDGDQAIESQQTGRVPNPDLPDTWNTVRKMACKRAHVAATLFVTGASELFTQDVEEQKGGSDDEWSDDAVAGGDYPREATPPQQAPRAAAPSTGARPVQGVPTSQDLERAIEEIRACRTLEDLAAHAQANRGKRWSKTQVEALKQANQDRRADIEGDGPPPGDDEIPF